MRKATLALIVLVLGVGSRSAWALSTQDTMTSWTAASAAERSGVMDEIMAKAVKSSHVSRSELMECLNRASSVGGHEQLQISEIAQACSNPSELDDPGKAGTGI